MLLALGFRAPIRTEWVHGGIGRIRAGRVPVENKIGGQVNEAGTDSMRSAGQVLRTACIHLPGVCLIGFRQVDGRIGRRIDDDVGLLQLHAGPHLFSIRDIQLQAIEPQQGPARRRVRKERLPQLPLRTRDENFHE